MFWIYTAQILYIPYANTLSPDLCPYIEDAHQHQEKDMGRPYSNKKSLTSSKSLSKNIPTHLKDHIQLVAFNTKHPQSLQALLTLRIVKDSATEEEINNRNDAPPSNQSIYTSFPVCCVNLDFYNRTMFPWLA